MDWFQNEKTGNIYYNSGYTEDDLNKIEGENWAYLGANDMFSNGETGTDDNSLLEKCKNLLTDGISTEISYNEDGSISSATTSASFDGNNAKEFMNSQGYDFLPTQQVRYESTENYYTEKQTINNGFAVNITEKSKYFKNGTIEKGTEPIKSDDALFRFGMTNESVNRFHIKYSNNTFFKGYIKVLQGFNKMYGTREMNKPTTYSSWREYPNNIPLINSFRNQSK